MVSHIATAAPRYSASVLDSATVGCFLLLYAIAALPRENVVVKKTVRGWNWAPRRGNRLFAHVRAKLYVEAN